MVVHRSTVCVQDRCVARSAVWDSELIAEMPRCWRRPRFFAASTVSTHAQTSDWTGPFSSNWFLSGNWIGGFPPTQTTDGNINTVTPNSTVVADPGALARNLTIGLNGTGTLTIQTGGTLADLLRDNRQFTGRAGHGDGDRRGLQLVECRRRSGRRLGHGHAYHPRRRHGEVVAAAPSDSLPARLVR